MMAGKKDIEISADPESDEDSTAEKMLSKSSTSLQGKVVSSSASKLSAPLLVQPIQSAPPSVDPTQSEDEEDDDNEEEIEDVRIPTVMVTKSDGDQLEMLLRDSERKMDSSSDISQSVSVQLNVAIEHMLFSSEFMGNFDYPKLWMRESVLFILGSGAWGAFLNSVAGSEDWQLFLLNQKDMTSSQLIPAVDIFTPNLQPISTSITLMANPVEAYLQHIRRRCPNQIIVSGSGRVIKLKK